MEFRRGVLKLRTEVEKRGGSIIHITPWAYDHATGKTKTRDYNEVVLGGFTKWLLERREAEGWHVIDLHSIMSEEIVKRRAKDPKFTFQRDGVHPNAAGHWLAAKVILQAYGDDQSAGAASTGEMMQKFSGGLKILPLVEQRMRLRRDAWLTKTKHQRPGVRKGLPLKVAERRVAEIDAEIEILRKAVREKE